MKANELLKRRELVERLHEPTEIDRDYTRLPYLSHTLAKLCRQHSKLAVTRLEQSGQ